MRAQRAGPDPAPGTRWMNFERGNVEDGYGNGDRGIGAGRMRGMVLRTGRRMARSNEGGSATLATHQDQTVFAPRAFSFDSLASNSMKSANPYSGCREVDTEKTLDCGTPDPNRNQGGIAIVQKGSADEQ